MNDNLISQIKNVFRQAELLSVPVQRLPLYRGRWQRPDPWLRTPPLPPQPGSGGLAAASSRTLPGQRRQSHASSPVKKRHRQLRIWHPMKTSDHQSHKAM